MDIFGIIRGRDEVIGNYYKNKCRLNVIEVVGLMLEAHCLITRDFVNTWESLGLPGNSINKTVITVIRDFLHTVCNYIQYENF